MISITLLSLPPETLRRMASHDTATETHGRRRERIAALAAVAMVVGLAIAIPLISALSLIGW